MNLIQANGASSEYKHKDKIVYGPPLMNMAYAKTHRAQTKVVYDTVYVSLGDAGKMKVFNQNQGSISRRLYLPYGAEDHPFPE